MSSARADFDFGGCGVALHGDGVEEDVEAGVAAGDDGEEVANDSASGRGDDACGVRECGQRAFAFGVEEAFGFEALLELFEGELERACADGFHGFCDELHLSALFVDADASADEDVKAVFRAEAKKLA